MSATQKAATIVAGFIGGIIGCVATYYLINR